jgi:hypothetical protein
MVTSFEQLYLSALERPAEAGSYKAKRVNPEPVNR